MMDIIMKKIETDRRILQAKKEKSERKNFRFSSSYGTRTRVFAVRGRRLDRLTNEPCLENIPYSFLKCKRFLISNQKIKDTHERCP